MTNNSILKKLQKQFLSINNSIESYFNNLKNFIHKYKKSRFKHNNKFIIATGIFLLLILSYFTLPTIYDKEIVKTQIKNQIFEQYNFELKFNEKISYSLLPKPHFTSKNISLISDKKNIANIKNFKIFISSSKLFAINNINISDILIERADFNIDKNDLSFFKNLLFVKSNKNKILIKKSNVFLKDKNDEVLLINKISNGKLHYDFQKEENILTFKNKVFNTPYKLVIRNNKFLEKIFASFSSHKIRLNIMNNFNYSETFQEGNINISFINQNTNFKYKINKNSLLFTSETNKNFYDGSLEFKPFYLTSNFNFKSLNLNKIFSSDSILFDLIKSEIMNNENLNAQINLKVDKFDDINHLKNLLLKVAFEDGNIIPLNSKIMWKNNLNIVLQEGLLTHDQNEININGKILIDIKDLNLFYKSFQVNRANRKKIKKIEFDFDYDFIKKEVRFDNIKIDDLTNVNIEKFVSKFNSNDKKILNKIQLKNFVENFFQAYSG